MSTNNDSFERLMEEVLKQQQLLEKLQAENRALRRQLADMRAGRGIFIEVQGQRIPLSLGQAAPSVKAPEQEATQMMAPVQPASLQQSAPQAAAPAAIEAEETREIAPVEMQQTRAISSIEQQETRAIPPAEVQQARENVRAVKAQETRYGAPIEQQETNAISPVLPPSFLEQLMLDEFASAATGPVTALTPAVKAGQKPEEEQKEDAPVTPEQLDEEKKAALRRELMGSFLLE